MIIVDYKSMDKTYEYIRHCRKYISGIDHFVVVDNASEIRIEPTIMEIDGHEICLVSSGDNAGYAKGNNLGAKCAQKLWNDKYYIFSNNDLLFEKPFSIEELAYPIEEFADVAVVGPNICTPQGSYQNPLPESSVRQILFGDFFNLLKRNVISETQKLSSGKCSAVSGAYMLVKADCFWKAGAFDENTFLFMEEKILSKRLEKINKTMYYNDAVEIIHNHGETVKSTIGIVKGLKTDFASRKYYAKQYCNSSTIILVLATIHFYIVIALFRIKKLIKKMVKKNADS